MSIQSVEMPTEAKAGQNLAYVDHLRGIAILMVIAVHAAQAVPNLSGALIILARYGQMGVQLFFVVSAYTLCRSHMSRMNEANSTTKFYIRRLFRIAPLYYLAIALYWLIDTVVSGFDRGPTPGSYTLLNIAANILFTHGFVPSANNVIVPGGWSIGTEMAFYAVFPILISLCLTVYSRHGARAIWILVAVAIVLSSAASITCAHFFRAPLEDNSFLYFNLLVQAPVFMLGIAAFFQYRESRMAIAAPRLSMLAFVILTLIAKMLMHQNTNVAIAILPVVSGASFVFLLDACRATQRSWRMLARIGQVSYSMYIFHFLFVWYVAGLILPKSPDVKYPSLVFAAIFFGGAALTFALAQVTEASIERRGIAIGKKICSLGARPEVSAV
jgi:peptidoglycan/LPS O-acetylase OafA/YrhL